MSSLLLDTHAFLWWRMDASALGSQAREAIRSADVVFVSVASAWEAAIKQSLGKLSLPAPFGVGVDESGFQRLGMSFPHAEGAAGLPLHHRDPFDRMLIAQARAEGLTVLTHDRHFELYEVDVIWT